VRITDAALHRSVSFCMSRAAEARRYWNVGFGSGYDVCYAVTGMWDLEVVMTCASVFPFLVSNVESDINRRFSSYRCVCVTVVNGYQGKTLILTVSVVEIFHITISLAQS